MYVQALIGSSCYLSNDKDLATPITPSTDVEDFNNMTIHEPGLDLTPEPVDRYSRKYKSAKIGKP